ncbi:uncharacterized protein LOC126081589 [Elephas maximus indicus]|uniref:uncharacterized protein LOC126081589 n=1 Tax=Elephas maximus indicus TaxID=99487 RepID=UPI0021162D3E|nr:uncharacterized protein LOC126081589 [Elephas maximus indicus]
MAPRSKKKAPNGRTRTPARPPGNAVGAGESARLLYLRAGGKFGGSRVIGLTWGGGTFRSFIGKFPLSSPPPRPHPLPQGLTIRPPKPFKNDLAPQPASLLPSPIPSPPPSSGGRGAISFRAGARGRRPRTRAQPGKRPEGTVQAALAAPPGAAVTAAATAASTRQSRGRNQCSDADLEAPRSRGPRAGRSPPTGFPVRTRPAKTVNSGKRPFLGRLRVSALRVWMRRREPRRQCGQATWLCPVKLSSQK